VLDDHWGTIGLIHQMSSWFDDFGNRNTNVALQLTLIPDYQPLVTRLKNVDKPGVINSAVETTSICWI
jgi:hypothetical protein